jgi:DNA-3-methyladenine glycosylase II
MKTGQKIFTVTEANFSEIVTKLGERDADLAAVTAKYGEPPMFVRPTGFATLVYIVLEQQVSMASARAAFERLQIRLGDVTPASFLTLDDAELKTIGFSRQKTLYCRELARAIVEKRLDLDSLESLSDTEVKSELTKIKGIGNWTADIYLLMCLRRANAFPIGDLGVIVEVQRLKNLPNRPKADELEEISAKWFPFRAVATRILWHSYLSR